MLELDLRQVVENELRNDEQIVWTDQPIPSHVARRALPISAFGLFFGGFAVFWFVGALGATQGSQTGWMNSIFPLFGLPFVAIGLAMFASPLFVARRARKTVYAITNQRAMIVTCGRWHKVSSFAPERLQTFDRTTRSDGSGDLIFGQDLALQGNHLRFQSYGFIGVREVRHVESLLRELANKRTGTERA